MKDCDRKEIFRLIGNRIIGNDPYMQLSEVLYDLMEAAYKLGLKNKDFDGVY